MRLVQYTDEAEAIFSRAAPGSSSSDSGSSSDSDSDSEDEPSSASKQPKVEDLTMDDDDDGGAVVSPDQVRTKNEVAEVQIVIPQVEQIEENEVMEKVGEVLSIVDKVVIVQGLSLHAPGRVSDRALDSDTLLVFEDRIVLGYVSTFRFIQLKPLLNTSFSGLGNIWPDQPAVLPGAVQRCVPTGL